MSSIVDSAVTATTAAVEVDPAPGSTTLYIFFGGMAAGIAMPPFEFYRAAEILADHKLFLRDFGQCWYHAGLPGYSTDLPSTVSYLRSHIEQLGVQRVVFVGNSMGGYAAMLFAALLGRGEVIAFAPQTFLSPWLRFKNGDGRCARQTRKVWWLGLSRKKVWDLRPLLAQRGRELRISLFVSPDDHLDLLHARHIEHLPGVTVHLIEGGGHDLVRLLRDNGSLPRIMLGAYAPIGNP